MGIRSRGFLGIFVLLFGLAGGSADNSFMKNAKISTRIVQTRYGRLQGLLVPMDQHRYLKPIEVFLGVPYATPPVHSNRFSPTRTPSPWDGVRVSDKMGPVCPQRLPNISNETAALDRMPKGRLEYLKRLLPLLKNQSEDCLYLNIFSPAQVNDCKKRWKNIRGSFTKYLNKKVPSGSSAKPIKPYYLTENLNFLQPFTKSRKSLGNTKQIQEENIANEIDSNKSDSELDAALSDTNEYAEKSSSEVAHVPKKKKETKKYPSLQEVNSSAFEYFQKKRTKLQECPEKNTEDPDRAFLISTLPDMKKMTDSQKRKFKIGILHLATEILEENRTSNSSVRQMISPLSESSSNPSNIQVYSPISIASPNQSANENIIRSYYPLQRSHGTDCEYPTSFSTQQSQGYSCD